MYFIDPRLSLTHSKVTYFKKETIETRKLLQNPSANLYKRFRLKENSFIHAVAADGLPL